MYYDAFESPDAMKGEEDPASPPSPLRDEELSVLQQRTRQLEARRGRITAKKVYLKNKKVNAERTSRLKSRQQPVRHSHVFFLSLTGNLYRQSQPEDRTATRW